jgi:hypothetical protein
MTHRAATAAARRLLVIRGGAGSPDSGKMILAINGVIAAVGGTFASTHSLAATVVAGGVGLVCAALFSRRN